MMQRLELPTVVTPSDELRMSSTEEKDDKDDEEEVKEENEVNMEMVSVNNMKDNYIRTRHGNIRCFPQCPGTHSQRSFCGDSVFINVYGRFRGKDMHVVGEFRVKETSPSLTMNQKITREQMDSYIPATLAYVYDDMARFSFNPQRKWEYKPRPRALQYHVFTAFFILDDQVCGIVNSTGFRLTPIWKSASGQASDDSASEPATDIPTEPTSLKPFDDARATPNSATRKLSQMSIVEDPKPQQQQARLTAMAAPQVKSQARPSAAPPPTFPMQQHYQQQQQTFAQPPMMNTLPVPGTVFGSSLQHTAFPPISYVDPNNRFGSPYFQAAPILSSDNGPYSFGSPMTPLMSMMPAPAHQPMVGPNNASGPFRSTFGTPFMVPGSSTPLPFGNTTPDANMFGATHGNPLQVNNNNIGMSNPSSNLFPQSLSKMVFPPSGQFGPQSPWQVSQQFVASNYVEVKQDDDEILRKKSRAASIGSSPQ